MSQLGLSQCQGQGAVASERPIVQAEKRIIAAFDELFTSVKRLELTFNPVLNPKLPETKGEEGPHSTTHIDVLFDKIIDMVRLNVKSIHAICDRTAI
jgi:hypothetical protein